MNILATRIAALLTLFTLIAPGAAAASDPESAAKGVQESVLPAHYLQGNLTAKSIPQAMLEQDIPGVSIAFIDDGEIAWRLAFGYADLANAAPVTPDTVFAAASLSKPVAAMAALNLVDQGLLSLDDDVNGYLHGWKIPENEFTNVEKVTLRRLIGHTAGVKNHLASSYDPDEPTPTVEEMLTGAAPSVDPPLVIEAVPGERYKYSNPGYSVIQKLIQDATGENFQTVVDRLIFTQAGMTQSSFAQPIPPELKSLAATGHTDDLQPYPDQLFPFLAMGGMWSTPSDLARFASALMADHADGRGRIISQELAAEVFARSEDRLGFGKKLGADDQLLFEHWGSNAGFTSYMAGYLPDNQALVIMTNSDKGFDLMASIARSVAREYGWSLLEPAVYEELSLPAESLQRFAGEFGGEKFGGAFAFAVEDGALTLSSPGDEAAQSLVPVASATFLSLSQNTTYEFIEGKDGAVRWVRVTAESGYNNDYPKN